MIYRSPIYSVPIVSPGVGGDVEDRVRGFRCGVLESPRDKVAKSHDEVCRFAPKEPSMGGNKNDAGDHHGPTRIAVPIMTQGPFCIEGTHHVPDFCYRRTQNDATGES